MADAAKARKADKPQTAAEKKAAKEHNDGILSEIMDRTTQREKLLVARALEVPFSEAMQDPDRCLMTLAWLKQKHEHGGADWDQFLDMTDDEVSDFLGLVEQGDDEDDETGAVVGPKAAP